MDNKQMIKLIKQLEQLKRLNDKIRDLQSTANALYVKLNQEYGRPYIDAQYSIIEQAQPEVK